MQHFLLFSHEASRDTGEAWAHPTAGQKLVRPAGLRHHGGRLVRGLDVAHQQPQVVIGAAGKFGINIFLFTINIFCQFTAEIQYFAGLLKTL